MELEEFIVSSKPFPIPLLVYSSDMIDDVTAMQLGICDLEVKIVILDEGFGRVLVHG